MPGFLPELLYVLLSMVLLFGGPVGLYETTPEEAKSSSEVAEVDLLQEARGEALCDVRPDQRRTTTPKVEPFACATPIRPPSVGVECWHLPLRL